ncbi:hypothetical protein NEOKW01_0793 [Nematocida sp. AWRm80]|nr:hypothetical protein NEOKW01_0793 [Nematocida sp. AWRm80]
MPGIKLLRKAPFLFDLKFMLWMLLGCILRIVHSWNASKKDNIREEIKKAQEERAGGKEEKEQAKSKSGNKKIAVVLDCITPSGEHLMNSLIKLGYYVVYPSITSLDTPDVSGLNYSLDKEESTDAFIRRVSQLHKKIDLLIINRQKYNRFTSKPVSLSGKEKKLVPSKKRTGFITKEGKYRDKDRIFLEKDRNARDNFLMGFLVLRGLASALKLGEGKVVICAGDVFGLVESSLKWPMFPSLFYSFCYSQMCSVLLGIGAKSRYSYLDVRILSTPLVLSDVFSTSPTQNKLLLLLSPDATEHAKYGINILKERGVKKSILYYQGMNKSVFDDNISGCDRANDLWEQAEIIS